MNIANRELPPGFEIGPYQGRNVVGEITESLHRFLMDGWTFDSQPPRLEEDLSFVPKDREEVIYIYMYRATQNTSLLNSKQWRTSKISHHQQPGADDVVYYERAPLYLNVYYLVCVHSKFRSDAERLLGWMLMRLYDATHLVYRPRQYTLPGGKLVDSMGRPWSVDADGGEELVMEKVAVSLVDDLTIGDAINFFTIHEAPFRPYATYRAQCAMEGPLISGRSSTVSMERTRSMHKERASTGRIRTRDVRPSSVKRPQIGPRGRGHRPIEDNSSED